jgi:hypothetical protein
MFNWREEGGGGYIKLAEGEKIEMEILSITKSKGKFNLKDKSGEDLGWHVKVETDKGILTIASWGLYYTFADSAVREGDVIELSCIKKGGLGKPGQYDITIKSRQEKEDQGEPTEETDTPF